MFRAYVALRYDLRQSRFAAAHEWLQSNWGAPVPSPTDPAVVAAMLNTTEEELAQWLYAQRDKSLPLGKAADDVAYAIRHMISTTEEKLLYLLDDGCLFLPWLQHIGVAISALSLPAVPGQYPSDSPLVLTMVDEDSIAAATKFAVSTGKRCVIHVRKPSPHLESHARIVDGRATFAGTASLLQHVLAFPTPDSSAYTAIRDAINRCLQSSLDIETSSAALSDFISEQHDNYATTSSNQMALVAFTEVKVSGIVSKLQAARQARQETLPHVRGTKFVKDIDQASSTANRASFLFTKTNELLDSVAPHTRLPFGALYDRLIFALKASTKGGQFSVEGLAKEFISSVLRALPDSERLLFCSALALSQLEFAGTIAPGSLRTTLRALRSSDIGAQLEFDRRQEVINSEARNAWEQQQLLQQQALLADTKKKAAPKKAEYQEKVVVECKPKYVYLNYESWSQVLTLSKSSPAFANLPQFFHEVEGAKGPTREARWRDWLSNPVGAVPFYEKDANVTPLDKLMLIYSCRPDRVVAALFQLVADVFGADLLDPYLSEELPDAIVAELAISDAPAVILLPRTSAVVDVETDVAAAMKSYVAMRMKPSEDKKKVVPLITNSLCSMHAADGIAALSRTISAAFAEGNWVLVHDTETFSAAELNLLLDLVRAARASSTSSKLVFVCGDATTAGGTFLMQSGLSRVALASPQGVKRAMLRFYNSVTTNVFPRLSSSTWASMLFVVSYVAAIIEQRCRYNGAGFSDVGELHRSDEDFEAAASLIVALSSKSAVPWDEFRELLSCLLGAALRDSRDRDIVHAYIDWLVHPEVLRTPSIGTLVFPKDATLLAQKQAIDALATDSSEMVGIHSNAEKKLQFLTSVEHLSRLESILSPPAPLSLLQQRAVELYSLIPTWSPNNLAMLHSESTESALQYFLFDEVRLLSSVCRTVQEALRNLQGPDGVSTNDVAAALLANKTPAEWKARTSNLDALPAWLADLQSRHQQLLQWAEHGRPGVVQLSLLFRPKALLSAFVQDACAEGSLPLEGYTFCLKVQRGDCARQPHPSPALADGVVICGVQLDGGQLDNRGFLVEPADLYTNWWQSASAAVPFLLLTLEERANDKTPSKTFHSVPCPPPLHRASIECSRRLPLMTSQRPSSASIAKETPVRPVLQRPTSATPTRGRRAASRMTEAAAFASEVYYAPLYASVERNSQSFICDVQIPTDIEHNHWVLRGAALSLML